MALRRTNMNRTHELFKHPEPGLLASVHASQLWGMVANHWDFREFCKRGVRCGCLETIRRRSADRSAYHPHNFLLHVGRWPYPQSLVSWRRWRTQTDLAIVPFLLGSRPPGTRVWGCRDSGT